MTYTVDPHRTFVIQPKEGEINYDLAEKSPLKFYDKVMSQDVVEHKVAAKQSERRDGQPWRFGRERLEMKTRTTKRAVAEILQAVQAKLQEVVALVTKNKYTAKQMREALDDPRTRGVV